MIVYKTPSIMISALQKGFENQSKSIQFVTSYDRLVDGIKSQIDKN